MMISTMIGRLYLVLSRYDVKVGDWFIDGHMTGGLDSDWSFKIVR